MRQIPVTPDATLDFVPIDHVAGGLVALAERIEAAAGGRYHLVSAAPIPVTQWAAAIGRYPQFDVPALVDPGGFDLAALAPIEQRRFARVAAPYASYFQRNPRFDDRCFAALTGIAAPPTHGAYLQRLIDFAIATGFLKGR